MQDRITRLCRKLLSVKESTDVHPTAEELRAAIAERVERLRAEAQDVALKLLQDRSETHHLDDDRVTMEADHVHRQQDERSSEASLA